MTRIQGITLRADSLDRDSENEIVELVGNVQIMYQDKHLSCDRAKINLRSKSLDALGNVIVVTPQATIGGDRVILDYESQTGLIFSGYVQSGNVAFEGTLIQKLSDEEYLAEDAKYTTCTTCPEAWSFSGKKIRAELGGYAYIKSSFLKLVGAPVFWMPYLVVPLKSDRQTGLLTPEIGASSSGGFTVAESFFWAMSRSQDSTWTFKNYELRGQKTLVNYRYVLSEDSQGSLDTAFLRDRVFANEGRLDEFRSEQTKGSLINRWFLKYQHYYQLPDGYIQRTQINNASDLQYPKDLPSETENHQDPAMENRTSLTKNTLSQHASIDASYYRNLLQSNPLGNNNDAVHRLPEIRYSQVQSHIADTEFVYSFDINYVNFARSEFAYDDLNAGYSSTGQRHLNATPNDGRVHPECDGPDWERYPFCSYTRDGKYDPGVDLIRTGQRLDMQPSIARPIYLGSLDILPRVSYRETQYTFEVDNSRNIRRYLRADLGMRTTFGRVFGDLSDAKSNRIKHEVQPEISMTTIPWIDHPSHRFFGEAQQTETPYFSQETITDADLNSPYGLQFDYNDRVYNRQLVTYGVVNRLIEKLWGGDEPTYQQFVSWRVAQSYDVYQASREGHPWSDILSDLKVTLTGLEIYQRLNHYPYQNITNTSTRVRLTNEKTEFIQVAQSKATSIKADSEGNRTKTEEYVLTAKKTISFIDLVARVAYDKRPAEGKSHFKAWGYGAQLRLPGDCLYVSLTQYHVPGGETISNGGFFFVWDGKAKPPLSEDLIETFSF